MKRRYGSAFGTRAAMAVGGAISNYVARRVRQRYGRSYTGTTSSRRTRSMPGTSAHYDRKTVYTKRSMPRYKRKRWVKFVKKVQAVHEKELGLQRVVFNDNFTVTQAVVDAGIRRQVVFGALLYSGSGGLAGSLLGDSDISRIMNLGGDGPAIPNAGSKKVKFTSGVLDYTFTAPISNNSALEVDVYEVTFRKGWSYDFTGVSLHEVINAYVDLQGAIGSGNKAHIDYRGVSLFEVGPFLSASGCKILKKVKHFVPPGDSFTHQIRDASAHDIPRITLTDNSNGVTYKNITKGLICIAKPVTDPAGDSTFSATQGCSRIYKYQRDDSIVAGTAYIA